MAKNYAVYKKHRASKNWTRIGSYRFKRTADKKCKEIKSDNPYMQCMIRKVKSYTRK